MWRCAGCGLVWDGHAQCMGQTDDCGTLEPVLLAPPFDDSQQSVGELLLLCGEAMPPNSQDGAAADGIERCAAPATSTGKRKAEQPPISSDAASKRPAFLAEQFDGVDAVVAQRGWVLGASSGAAGSSSAGGAPAHSAHPVFDDLDDDKNSSFERELQELNDVEQLVGAPIPAVAHGVAGTAEDPIVVENSQESVVSSLDLADGTSLSAALGDH